MAKKTQKNRRCRDAKISEYKLKKLVMCFAKNMTAQDTAKETRLSEPTVRHRYMQLRQLLYDHGPMRMSPQGAKDRPAKYIYERHYRGVKEKYAHLFEMEVLNRIFATRNVHWLKRFDAGNEKHMQQVMKYVRYNQTTEKYVITEMLFDADKDEAAREKRPFELADYKHSSTIIVSEKNLSPDEALFRLLRRLLLEHPL